VVELDDLAPVVDPERRAAGLVPDVLADDLADVLADDLVDGEVLAFAVFAAALPEVFVRADAFFVVVPAGRVAGFLAGALGIDAEVRFSPAALASPVPCILLPPARALGLPGMAPPMMSLIARFPTSLSDDNMLSSVTILSTRCTASSAV
jgi:hypothetical protein